VGLKPEALEEMPRVAEFGRIFLYMPPKINCIDADQDPLGQPMITRLQIK
jgi:hypothetical protein